MAYITSVLFHLMSKLMRAGGASAPKAVLTQLVLAALLTLVSEAVEMRAFADATRHWMSNVLNNGETMKYVEPDKTGRAGVGERHAEEIVESYRHSGIEAGP